MKDNLAQTLLMYFKQTHVPSAGLSHIVHLCMLEMGQDRNSGTPKSKETEQNLDCSWGDSPGAASQGLQEVKEVSLPELCTWYWTAYNKTDLWKKGGDEWLSIYLFSLHPV